VTADQLKYIYSIDNAHHDIFIVPFDV
jgi:hypothetical protein